MATEGGTERGGGGDRNTGTTEDGNSTGCPENAMNNIGGGNGLGNTNNIGSIGNRENNTGCPGSTRSGLGGTSANNTRRRRRKQNKVLKCMTVNAQSLKYKMEEFREVIDREKPLIVSVTETWGKEWMGDAIFSLKDYYYRDDRDEKEEGGHCFILVKNWDKGHVNH